MTTDLPIYVIDDDPAVRHALHASLTALGHSLIASFASGEAFLEALPAIAPGCVLLDINLPGLSGWDVQSVLSESTHRFPVVILTGAGDITKAVRAMRMGAIDFLEKPFDIDSLEKAVVAACENVRAQFESRLAVDLARARIALLSHREHDVLLGLIDGHANKVIAMDLKLSPRTVEIHRAKLMDKLGAKSLGGALRVAFAAGMIER